MQKWYKTAESSPLCSLEVDTSHVKKITVIPGDGRPQHHRIRHPDPDPRGVISTTNMQTQAWSRWKHGELLLNHAGSHPEKNKVTLKGPLTTPVGGGFTSINVSPAQSSTSTPTCARALLQGRQGRYDNIDIITVRENTEGMYSGAGQKRSDDNQSAEAMSIISRKGRAHRHLRLRGWRVRKGARRSPSSTKPTSSSPPPACSWKWPAR